MEHCNRRWSTGRSFGVQRGAALRGVGWSSILTGLLWPGSALGAEPGAVAATASAANELSLAMVFTCFMVMLGPIKVVGRFVALTGEMDEAAAHRAGLKAFGIACATGLLAATSGQKTLSSWGVGPSSLHLAAGLILLLVAVRGVMAQYAPSASVAKQERHPDMILTPLTFPTIITPHGLAAFILILALSTDLRRELLVCALFLIVMGLNLLVMWFARPIMRRCAFLLQILGAVLGVLQVALAVEMLVEALRSLNVIA